MNNTNEYKCTISNGFFIIYYNNRLVQQTKFHEDLKSYFQKMLLDNNYSFVWGLNDYKAKDRQLFIKFEDPNNIPEFSVFMNDEFINMIMS